MDLIGTVKLSDSLTYLIVNLSQLILTEYSQFLLFLFLNFRQVSFGNLIKGLNQKAL